MYQSAGAMHSGTIYKGCHRGVADRDTGAIERKGVPGTVIGERHHCKVLRQINPVLSQKHAMVFIQIKENKQFFFHLRCPVFDANVSICIGGERPVSPRVPDVS